MPSLQLRGRYLLREYWSDSDLFLRLDPSEREILVGLWMLADDEGFLPRDVPEIAAALFRFEDRTPREAKVRDVLERLRTLGKIESLRCCLFIPSVLRYPRSGKKSTDHRDEHRRHSARSRGSNGSEAIRTDSNRIPDPTLPVPDSVPSRPSRARAGGARSDGPRSFGEALEGTPFGAELAARRRGAG